MTDLNHRALLSRIAARNSDSELAMTLLYRALAGSVSAFVRRHLSFADDHEVQAVTVDALYEVWRAAPDFNGGSLVKTWVLGIARHKALDAVRSNPRATAHSHVDIDDYADSMADDSADVLTILADRQRAQQLDHAMNQLPLEQRECLHLLLVEGLTVKEIALVQNCPCGTVKTRVFHAKAKLRQSLAQWLEVGPGVRDSNCIGSPEVPNR
jgi:RNA polymerase sigma-70 factor (ECF subfamily)